MGEIAGVLQLLCKKSHHDKRPANALLARAVEMCSAKGFKYLTYGQYVYGNKSDGLLTEFKRRNGFQQLFVPRYYIPLTAMGSLALRYRLHHGLKRLVPGGVWTAAVRVRAKWYKGMPAVSSE
jgi:hypothetical protein